nr:hypothetical protein 20 [Pseudomonadaceae bacterium]
MPTFRINSDLEKVVDWANDYEPKAAKPALNFTLNRVGRRITTASNKEVARVQEVKQKLIKARVKETRSNFRTLRYRAVADVRGITWMSLGAKEVKSRSRRNPRGRGVRAGRHVHRHAFIAKARGGKRQVMVRNTSHPSYNGRYPLRVLRVRLFTPFAKAFKEQLFRHRSDLVREFKRDFKRRVERLNKKASNA